eukprot:9219705-Pyramimonas_sp.AAC.1
MPKRRIGRRSRLVLPHPWTTLGALLCCLRRLFVSLVSHRHHCWWPILLRGRKLKRPGGLRISIGTFIANI